MFLSRVFLFTLIWIQTGAYNILCLLPYPGKSHYMVFEPLLQELESRGHNLTVVSFFPKQNQSNRRDVDLRSLASLNIEIVDLRDFDYSVFGLEKYFEHIPLITGLAKSNLHLCKRILDSEMFEEFIAAKGDYDVILVEHFNSDCMLGIIHNYGLPSVGLMSTSMLPWTPRRVGASDNPAHIPEMMMPFTSEMSFFERIQNTICHYFYIWWYEIAIRWEEQRILEKKLGKRLPKLENIAKNTSVVLINTYHVWNGVRSVPPSLLEVGGLHLHNKILQPLHPDLEKWVSEAKDGFIILSFGSLIRGSTLPEKRLRTILKVFARLPQRVVWKWEGNFIDVPDNVLILKWLPQYDLLRHKNCVAFITHAGLLSLTEAVSAGVPMLAVPILGDQYGNAAHAQRVGIACVLRLQNLDEVTLEDSLKKVLTSEMRERAKLVSKQWQDRPISPMENAIYHIERTVRYKGQDMSTHARWLSTWELELLDVLVFIVGTLVIAFLVVRNAFNSFHRKEKQC
ncbi:UDP-glucosyltransferase 2-like [Epargyreus clarus]|uniref:UDP-glucosyltransferase 2-like n=1 Tax=Epargyreus clarus TaxID=520877 RepID=UPI003C2B8F4B